MALFDADAYLEALEPPSIKIGGKTYVGRFLSIEEWLPLEPRIQQVAKSELGIDEIKEVVKDYCMMAFPPSWKDLFSTRKTVAELVLALPPAAMMKATTSFFKSQARALQGNPATQGQEEET